MVTSGVVAVFTESTRPALSATWHWLACGLGALLLHQVDESGAATVVAMVFCVRVVIAVLESAARMRQDIE